MTLSVDVEALVCKDICIPEYGSLDLILNDPATSNEDNSAYLAQSLEQVPEERDWQADFSAEGKNFRLNVSFPQNF